MVKAVNDRDEPSRQVDCDPGPEPDAILLDLLDALVEARGRVPAARVLVVNYRTLELCCDSRQVSHRMRRALLEFRERGGEGGGEAEDGEGEPVVVDGDNRQDDDGTVLRQRVAELEDENTELRELVGEWARQLKGAGRRGDDGGILDVDVAADAYEVNRQDYGDSIAQDWRPLWRRPGVPDACVVTLEEQSDEEFAFGPAARLVAEWRHLRTGRQPC